MKILKCDNNNVHFESFDVYSTEEQVIGQWIDGKPLYRKFFSLKDVSEGTDYYIPFQCSPIKLNGFMIQNPSKNKLFFPLFDEALNTKAYYDTQQSKIVFKSIWNLFEVVIILEYTKA